MNFLGSTSFNETTQDKFDIEMQVTEPEKVRHILNISSMIWE